MKWREEKSGKSGEVQGGRNKREEVEGKKKVRLKKKLEEKREVTIWREWEKGSTVIKKKYKEEVWQQRRSKKRRLFIEKCKEKGVVTGKKYWRS